MVQEVVHEWNRQLGDHVKVASNSLAGGLVFEGANHGDTVVADHETSVGASVALGIVDGGVDTVPEGLKREGKSGAGLGRHRGLRAQQGNATEKQEGQSQSSHVGAIVTRGSRNR